MELATTLLDFVKSAGSMAQQAMDLIPAPVDIAKSAGLIALPFTIYFAWTKLGYRIGANYQWRFDRLIAPGIGSVTLINMKDRPLAVFEIHAVVPGGLSISLKTFEPPMILKGLEATVVNIDPVSSRHIGNEPFEWKDAVGPKAKVTIYLSTSSRTIKCRPQSPPTRLGFAIKNNLRVVTSRTDTFNGRIYNERALFAVIYTNHDKSQSTALLDGSGFIDWPHRINGISRDALTDAKTVKAAIIATGLQPIISPFAVEDLRARAGRPRGT